MSEQLIEQLNQEIDRVQQLPLEEQVASFEALRAKLELVLETAERNLNSEK
jgi:hypothetical protein